MDHLGRAGLGYIGGTIGALFNVRLMLGRVGVQVGKEVGVGGGRDKVLGKSLSVHELSFSRLERVECKASKGVKGPLDK